MKNIIDALNWRYATKQYDTTKKLSDEQVDMLLESLRLAPSSFGLQPWKFVVVKNPEIRAKLREVGNQPQITDASHFVVLTVRTDINDALVDEFISSVSKTTGAPIDALKGYEDVIKGSVNSKTPEARVEWGARQVYIALGVLLSAAATEGIDASPMEGFDPQKFDEILGLEKLNLKSVVIAALGYRSPSDTHANDKKTRFSKSEVIVEVK